MFIYASSEPGIPLPTADVLRVKIKIINNDDASSSSSLSSLSSLSLVLEDICHISPQRIKPYCRLPLTSENILNPVFPVHFFQSNIIFFFFFPSLFNPSFILGNLSCCPKNERRTVPNALSQNIWISHLVMPSYDLRGERTAGLPPFLFKIRVIDLSLMVTWITGPSK